MKAALAGAALAAILASPAPAADAIASPAYFNCGGDAACEHAARSACMAGDDYACAILRADHRDNCRADPEHDDCAMFRGISDPPAPLAIGFNAGAPACLMAKPATVIGEPLISARAGHAVILIRWARSGRIAARLIKVGSANPGACGR